MDHKTKTFLSNMVTVVGGLLLIAVLIIGLLWGFNKLAEKRQERQDQLQSASKLLVETSNQYYQQKQKYTDNIVSLAAVNPEMATLKGAIKIELSPDNQAAIIKYKLNNDAPEEKVFVLSEGRQVKE
jgi:hypothetical protein